MEKFNATIAPSLTSLSLLAMNIQRIRMIFATPLLAAILCACGGSTADGSALQTAALVQTAPATRAVDLSVDPAAVGQTPAADCAAEACAGLRIIDGNAEAFRLDAMRRAAQDNG